LLFPFVAVVENINKQNLSWTATFNPEYEGLSVKEFGLGFLPLIDDKYRKHVLVNMMAQIDPPSSEPNIPGAQTPSPQSTIGTRTQGAGLEKLSRPGRRALQQISATTPIPTAPAN
jgi:hypothetical protein